jgi:multidrug efflux system outer membrane protein
VNKTMNTHSNWKHCVTTVAASLVLALLAAGCNVGPKYKRPTVAAPDAFRGADDAAVSSAVTASIGDQKWPEVFHEPELQALINEALTNNFDVRIAAQRILEQEQQIKITRSQQFPQVSIGGTGIGADFPSGSFGSGNNSIADPLSVGSFSLSASWTPDFWGLYRKQTAQQRALLLNQQWAQRAVRVTLVQQIAAAYLQIRAMDRELEITRQTVKAREDSVKLTKTLADGGSAPLSDLRQAEQLLYTATSQIPILEQGIQQQENAISLLLGRNPGSVTHRDPDALTPPPQDLPTGMPSQLLERRPDIQQAEAQLVAANAAIGIARAQFFPQLTISASAGVGGDSFPTIFGTNSKTIYGIGSLAQPIFTGGKLKGQLQLSKEQEKELVITYQKTILGALRDVSNALIASNKQRFTRIEQEKLVAAAQDSTRLARMRYQGGATGYLEVLTVDTNLYTAQLNLATAQGNEALTLVNLYAALGGGWQ